MLSTFTLLFACTAGGQTIDKTVEIAIFNANQTPLVVEWDLEGEKWNDIYFDLKWGGHMAVDIEDRDCELCDYTYRSEFPHEDPFVNMFRLNMLGAPCAGDWIMDGTATVTVPYPEIQTDTGEMTYGYEIEGDMTDYPDEFPLGPVTVTYDGEEVPLVVDYSINDDGSPGGSWIEFTYNFCE